MPPAGRNRWEDLWALLAIAAAVALGTGDMSVATVGGGGLPQICRGTPLLLVSEEMSPRHGPAPTRGALAGEKRQGDPREPRERA